MGITFDKFTRDKRGLFTGEYYNGSEKKFDFFYLTSISRSNVLDLPIKIELLFKHKGLTPGNFATDSEQPSVGAIDVKELQVNFAYTF